MNYEKDHGDAVNAAMKLLMEHIVLTAVDHQMVLLCKICADNDDTTVVATCKPETSVSVMSTMEMVQEHNHAKHRDYVANVFGALGEVLNR